MVHNYSVPVMSSPKTAETSPSPAPSSVGGNNMAKFGTVIPNRVFVGGISSTTTEQDLLELFSKYGTVKATKIITDRAGVSKGYGFVTFETEDEATRLTQEQADNIMLKDRKLNIAPAVKKQITEYTGFMKAYSPRLVDGAPGGVITNPAVLFANHSAAAAAAYYNQQHLLSAVAAATNNGAMGQEYAPAHSHASYMHQQAMHSQAAAQNQAAVALAASNAGSGGSATPTQPPQYVQAGTPHQQQTFFYQPSLYYPQYQLAAAAANQQAAQSPQVYGQQIVSPNGGWQAAAAGGHWRFLNQGIGGYAAGGAVPQPSGSCSTDPRSHNLSQESSSSDSCSFCSSICCLENDSSCFLDDHKPHNNSYCHTCNTHTSNECPVTSSPTISAAAALANNPPNPSAPIGYVAPYSRGWYPTPGHHYSMVVPPFPSIFSSLPPHRSTGGRVSNASQ